MAIQYHALKLIVERNGIISNNLQRYYDDYNLYLKNKNNIKPKYEDYKQTIIYPEQILKEAHNIFFDSTYYLLEGGMNGIDHNFKIMTWKNEQSEHSIFRMDEIFIIFTTRNKKIIDVRKFNSEFFSSTSGFNLLNKN